MKTKVNEIQRHRSTGIERERDRERKRRKEYGWGVRWRGEGEDRRGRRGGVEGSNRKWLQVFKMGIQISELGNLNIHQNSF